MEISDLVKHVAGLHYITRMVIQRLWRSAACIVQMSSARPALLCDLCASSANFAVKGFKDFDRQGRKDCKDRQEKTPVVHCGAFSLRVGAVGA
jgi:hypothetical protein